MLDTVVDADGAGFAAPQIHESLKIVVLEAPLSGRNRGNTP